MLATQGATRLGKSGGLQSLSGGFQRHYFPFKDGDRKKTTTLDVQEFISRFLLHVLPEGFVRTRHFGFLANRSKKQILAQCRKLLKLDPAAPEISNKSAQDLLRELTGIDLSRCPLCQKGIMIVVGDLPPLSSSLRWDSS
jgi:hypothetical protein